MSHSTAALRRLHYQHLTRKEFTSPLALVASMGAMQAQDYHGVKWAIGTRLAGITHQQVEDAISNGGIVRTHLLRPTWHLASAEDVRWMLRLSAPQIMAANTARHREQELDNKVLNRSVKLIAKALAKGTNLTRAELMEILGREGIRSDDNRSAHIMMFAELEEVVCNGSMRGRQFTYALMDERVPQLLRYDADEALRSLALRYFTSHGPATLQDFYWWSGLRIGDARKALEAAAPALATENVAGQDYWFSSDEVTIGDQGRSVFFLPSFDEFLVAYRDRTASLNPAHNKAAITVNGIFYPILVSNGQVLGTWKKTLGKDGIRIETSLLPGKKLPAAALIRKALKPLGEFYSQPIIWP